MNYADKYVENMVNVGYHSLNRDEMKSAFEKYFNEYLDTENYREAVRNYLEIRTDSALDHNLFCAALAQIKACVHLGCFNTEPFNIKTFWGLTEEEVNLIIEHGDRECAPYILASIYCDEHEEDDLY